MAIKDQKPKRRVGVGAQYTCFRDPTNESGYEEDVYRDKTVTSIETTENADSENIWGSNDIYDTDTGNEPPQMTVENIAIPPQHRARMKGNRMENGFIVSNNNDEGEHFARGVVYPKKGGGAEYVWYPKCVAVEISDSAQTKDDGGSNTQYPSTTIQALPFNAAGDFKVAYDTELLAAGEVPVTEEEFFAVPLLAPIPAAPEV